MLIDVRRSLHLCWCSDRILNIYILMQDIPSEKSIYTDLIFVTDLMMLLYHTFVKEEADVRE